jgi:hypothetical protein
MAADAMSKERLYLFDTTLRARRPAGATSRGPDKTENVPSRGLPMP